MEESKMCAVCGSVTVHYDGACEQCLMRRQQSAPSSAPPVAKRERGYLKIKIGTLVFIALLVVVAGFVHIVHGGGVGLKICGKESWGLGDTFVDLDDYIGKPLISKIDKANVLRAMFACEALQRPNFDDKKF